MESQVVVKDETENKRYGVYVHKSHPLYTHHYNCSCDACANCAVACPFCGCLCVTIDCELCGCEDAGPMDVPEIDLDRIAWGDNVEPWEGWDD